MYTCIAICPDGRLGFQTTKVSRFDDQKIKVRVAIKKLRKILRFEMQWQ